MLYDIIDLDELFAVFTYFLIFLHILLNIGHIIWRVFCSICKPTLNRCANFAMIRNVFLQTLRRVKPQVLSIQYFVGISMKFLGTFWNINLQIEDEIRPCLQYLHYLCFIQSIIYEWVWPCYDFTNTQKRLFFLN